MTIDLYEQLKSLQLHGMAIAWNEIKAESPRQTLKPEALLTRLITTGRGKDGKKQRIPVIKEYSFNSRLFFIEYGCELNFN